MPTLLQLIATFPVLEAILPILSYADLLNLSRTSSGHRAILHGFNFPGYGVSPMGPETGLPVSEARLLGGNARELRGSQKTRSNLCIGNHQTDTWRNYKSIVRWLCSEPHHTIGQIPKQCLRCSMPVCETCIIKSSMKKNQHTFDRRRRYICENCWTGGNPHHEGRRIGLHAIAYVDYDRSNLCHCTSSDGTLCLSCIEQQNSDLDRKLSYCAAYDCSNKVTEHSAGGRVCLWCTNVLPCLRSMDKRKKEYDTRHLFPSRSSHEEMEQTEKMKSSWEGRKQAMGFEDQRWVPKTTLCPSPNLSFPSSSSPMPGSLRELETKQESNDLGEAGESRNDEELDFDKVNVVSTPRLPVYHGNGDFATEINLFLGYLDDEETLVAHDDGDQVETMTLDANEENSQGVKNISSRAT